MTLHLGDVPAGSTLYIPFATYGANGQSITMSGFAVTDIEVYKNGSTIQRTSDAGFALLDTDGIDFDGLPGIHGFSMDLNDNTDAGFYAVGSWYWVVVSSITANSQTVNFIAATFRIVAAEAIAGKPKVDVDAWLGTAASTPNTAGTPDVNARMVGNSTTAATILARYMNAGDTGTADSGTTTTLTDTSLDADHDGAYVGFWLIMGEGTTASDRLARRITAFDQASDTITFEPALPAAVVAGDDYCIVPAAGVDVVALDGSSSDLKNLARGARAAVRGAAITGTLSTTQMTTDLTEATDDHYNGRSIVWTSGALAGQASDITDYDGTTKMLTYSVVTDSPSNGDTFIIV
jgi:hypothetical protein